MNRKMDFRGVFPAVPTTFSQNGNLDLDDMGRLVRFLVDEEADGIFCLVMGGEFYKMSERERRRVAETTLKCSQGDVPVFIGVTHSGLTPSLSLAKHAESIGADGIVVSYPYFAPFIAEAEYSLFRCVSALCESVEIPVILQDYSSHGSISLSSEQLSSITQQHENVSAIKVEGTGHLEKIKEYLSSSGRKAPILGGMLGKNFLEELKIGTSGTIPGSAIPEIYRAIYQSFTGNNREEAKKHQLKSMAYIDFLTERFLSFVSIEKHVLKLRGVIGSHSVREPSIVMQESDVPILKKILSDLEKNFEFDLKM